MPTDYFTIKAGATQDVDIMVDNDAGITLSGAQVWFQVFLQSFGVPNYEVSGSPWIDKSTANGGIDALDSPGDMMTVHLVPADTIGLAGNYYFEVRLVDENLNVFPSIAQGIMSVQPSYNTGA